MKETGGKANPAVVNAVLRAKLGLDRREWGERRGPLPFGSPLA
jgi:hypothetical protein